MQIHILIEFEIGEFCQPIVLLHSMIGYWHHPVVHSSVCLSVTLCIVALRVGVHG